MEQTVEAMTSPMVSVLLPFVNEGALLGEAIESMVQQTYSSFELILIDNGADDGTRTIATAGVNMDKRIKLVHEDVNGISNALNRGIQEAKGGFIARMDADDISHPERLHKQVSHLMRHPGTGVVSCLTELFPVTTDNEGYREFVAWQNGIVDAEAHFTQRFIESPIAHPSVMMRRELFELYGNYSTAEMPEDYELWLRWMEREVRFEKVPEVLLYWRDHSSRLSRNHANYSSEAFSKVKSFYLAQWLKRNLDTKQKVVVCGSSKNINAKINLLEKEGVEIHGVTDVKLHGTNGRRFIPLDELIPKGNHFVLNLIARRDLREPIRDFLKGKGFREGLDCLMAG